MSEFQALAIERFDREVLDYFIERFLRDNPGVTRETAENAVRGRARIILQQSDAVTRNTLATLESLMLTAEHLPGRKIVFFISDGFFLNTHDSNSIQWMRQVTSAAARAGVVIYSMDARGLITGMPDASVDIAIDPTGRLDRSSLGEIPASQEAFFTLAAETGGRAYINSNKLNPGITEALKETSNYYLLAWRPDPETQHGTKFRKLEIKVIGHPDLTVLSRRGFGGEAVKDESKPNSKTNKNKTEKTPEAEMREAVGELFERRALPISLSVNYLDMPDKGGTAYTTIQFDTGALAFDAASGKQTAVVDLMGVIFNDQGKQVSGFKDRLTITANSTESKNFQRQLLGSGYHATLSPGLYQIRLAARDQKSGKMGTVMQWIEIPDLSAHRLAMSSLIIAEMKADARRAVNPLEDTFGQVSVSADRRFARTSKLRFLTFIYNASRGPSGNSSPDVALQIQIFRNDQPVLTDALRKVSITDLPDLARIPYAAEIPLDGMPAGRYVLSITTIDRLAKTSAAQQVSFTIQ
jgi:hypothetical protein